MSARLHASAHDTWGTPTPWEKYGIRAPQPATRVDTAMSSIATPAAGDQTAHAPWHHESPLFWFAVITAGAAGLLFASTSIRVGPVRAGVSLGKEKK